MLVNELHCHVRRSPSSTACKLCRLELAPLVQQLSAWCAHVCNWHCCCLTALRVGNVHLVLQHPPRAGHLALQSVQFPSAQGVVGSCTYTVQLQHKRHGSNSGTLQQTVRCVPRARPTD